MNMRELTIAAASLLVLGALLSSCVSEPVGKIPPRWKDRKPQAKTFKPITNHELELDVISERRTFPAGSDVTIDFRLINRGEKKVVVEEWLQEHDANLKVYYQIKQGDTPSGVWICIETKVPPNPLRFPLELNPGNAVLISCNLKFIKELSRPNKPLEYFLRGELNLKSLPLASEPVVITIK